MITPGTLLGGKYLVERTLGEGGMGIVVAAKHAQLGHRVAIKMMLGDAVRDADALARFDREARAAAELSSEHVARVTDVGHFEDGMPFMVMEYLEGEDLAARIQRGGPVPVGDVIRMFIQACIGLGDAHEHGIIHRDIKPSNLFLSTRRGGRVTLKVLDFGIAKANLTTSDHQLTRTSALMGSPQYMSPEQLRDSKNVDARTDMWSLGASMYEAMTGVPAFPAETLAELHVKILMEQPTPTFHHRSEIPLELDSIVMRCLAKQPAERFRSMQGLQDVLENAERSLSIPRAAFQSNPALIETALPATESDLAFGITGAAAASERVGLHAAELERAPRSAGLRRSDAGPMSLPPQGEMPSAPRNFVPTFAATDNPISTTNAGFEALPARKPPRIGLLAVGAVGLFIVAFAATKLVAGTPASPSAQPAAAAVPSAAAVVPQPSLPVPPTVQPAIPQAIPVEAPVVEAPRDSVAPEPAVPDSPKATKRPGAKPRVKLSGSASVASDVPSPTPSVPTKKKKFSSLDPELE